MAAASPEQIRSALEQAGVRPDAAAALAESAARRPLAQRDWLYPVLAAARNAANVMKGGVGAVALLGLLGWIALSIHEMNARLGVVETRLIAVEEGQALAREERQALAAGLEQVRGDLRALDRKVDDLARR